MFKFFYWKRKDWIKTFRKSWFILSFVGNSRGCYRTDEILELGLFEIPYYLDWLKVGIVITDSINIIQKLDKIDDKELNEMRKYICDTIFNQWNCYSSNLFIFKI